MNSAEMLDQLCSCAEEMLSVDDPPDARLEGANYLANAAFAALFVNRPENAERWSRTAIEVLKDPSSDREGGLRPEFRWIYTNLAHGLLFQGKYDEALAIYREHWSQRINDSQTFGQSVLEDFEAFEKAGITHPDMRKIRENF